MNMNSKHPSRQAPPSSTSKETSTNQTSTNPASSKGSSQQHAAFNGVVVLTLALIIVKVLSAIYRVPYQNVLGDTGLYAYQQIYPIVALGMILSMNAIPSAVTQTLDSNGQASAFSRVLIGFQLIGLAIFAIILVLAHPIAILMGDPHLAPMLRMASLSYLFIGVLGVFRGYYQSRQRMHIPAISQVIEQFIRVGIIIVAITLFMLKHWTIYQAGTLAILASALGFLGSSLYLMFTKPFPLKRQNPTAHIPWKQLLIATVIFALSQLLVIMWQFIDSFTVVHTLQSFGLQFKQAIMQKGIYDRGASFIQMGLIVTTTFSFVLIPLLTQAIEDHNKVQMNRYANASLKITILISAASGVGLINLLPIMNQVFFKTDSLSFTLGFYMLTVICVSLIMMDIALLQVFNRIRPIITGVIIGLVSKTILNIVLIHHFGIAGASVSTVLSLVLFVIVLHIEVMKHYRFNRMRYFILKTLFALAIMSLVVQCVMYIMPPVGRLGGLVELLIVAVIGVGVLLVLVMLMNILGYKELKHLPFGDKLYHMKKGRRS
ncbi:low temperature requirement B protein [Staphylococcus petrasii]|nr:low temperature requirement B protein [Staphylococcus petrasii]